MTAAVVTFRVDGTPIPQGSKKAYVVKGTNRARIVDDNKDLLKPWRAAVTKAAAASHAGPALEGALTLSVIFRITRPKTVKRPFPSVKPDLDKLVRAIKDGITDAKVWGDDGQVVTLFADEQYSHTPGATVRIGYKTEGLNE